MKDRVVFLGLLANFISYAGEFDFHYIDAKINSAIPEIAFYHDASAFLDDTFFDKTSDLTPIRRRQIFAQLFARNFGFHVWFFHRKKLMQIADYLYQTIMYEREQLGLLSIADFDRLENDSQEDVDVQIIQDEE